MKSLLIILLLSLNIGVMPSVIYENESNFYDLIENINEDELSFDNDITVIIEFDYMENSIKPVELSNNLNENRIIKEEIIKNNKEYYLEKNKEILANLQINYENMFVSKFSPFVFINFDNYFDYEKNIEEIQDDFNDEIVSTIYIDETPTMEEDVTINSDPNETLMYMNDAISMMDVDNSIYKGSGIKIGILDGGIPDDFTNFSENDIVETNNSNSSDHTTKVGSIISGTYGIAPDAELYFASYKTIIPSLEWLIEKGVDVINMSFGYNAIDGKYTGYSAYMDHIVAENYIAIVKSAGNRGASDKLITHPGMGLNVITVGSIDINQSVSYYSSYMVDTSVDELILKPTLVAPGENIWIPNTNNSTYDKRSGTSFAAPMVTGVIALLMEEYPRIMAYPEVIMSVLMSSAKMISGQEEVWETSVGAGLINHENASDLLGFGNYVDSIVSSTVSSNTEVLTKSITIAPHSILDFAFVSHFDHNITTLSNTNIEPLFTRYNILVFDENNKPALHTKFGTNSNTIIGTLENRTSINKTYTIKVFLDGNKVGVENEYICLSLFNNENSHKFSTWTYYSRIAHIEVCDCGAMGTVTRAHVIRSSDIVNNKANCLECGHLLDLSTDIAMVYAQNNAIKYSINGSYIFSSGIVVLMDEDLDSYFAGTLIFYKEDEIPQLG